MQVRCEILLTQNSDLNCSLKRTALEDGAVSVAKTKACLWSEAKAVAAEYSVCLMAEAPVKL